MRGLSRLGDNGKLMESSGSVHFTKLHFNYKALNIQMSLQFAFSVYWQSARRE